MFALKRKRGNPDGDLPNIRIPPHHRLPFELMSQILVDVCLEKQDRRAVLALTQVCRAWRNIASSTPQLWSDYYLFFRDGSFIPLILQRAAMWLSLSRQLFCTVRVNFSDCPAGTVPDLSPFYAFFASIAHRMQSLTLGGPYWTLLLKMLPPSLPSLTTLRLKLDVKYPVLCYSSELSLSQSRRLKHVELQNTHDFFTISTRFYPPLLPWSQITALSMMESNWPSSILYETLRACSGLVYLQLKWLNWLPDAPPSIVMRNLTTLIIRHSSDGLAPFLDSLTLPSLTELTLEGRSDLASHAACLLNLHRRSPFPLRSFSCKNIRLESQPFIQLLHRASTLEQLYLQNCAPLGDLLNDLTTYLDGEPILPLLHSVSLGPNSFDPSKMNESIIIDFVESRFWSNDQSRPRPHLRYINFSIPVEPDLGGELHIRSSIWRSNGLAVHDMKKDFVPVMTCPSRVRSSFRSSYQDLHDL